MNADTSRRAPLVLDTGVSISSLILILLGVVMSYSATATDRKSVV